MYPLNRGHIYRDKHTFGFIYRDIDSYILSSFQWNYVRPNNSPSVGSMFLDFHDIVFVLLHEWTNRENMANVFR